MAEFPKSEIQKHLFVCTNRPPMKEGETRTPEKCGYKNSEKLRAETKELCKSMGKSVRINSAGCLGRCEEGIVAVLYPEGRWITGLKDDEAGFLAELVAGKT